MGRRQWQIVGGHAQRTPALHNAAWGCAQGCAPHPPPPAPASSGGCSVGKASRVLRQKLSPVVAITREAWPGGSSAASAGRRAGRRGGLARRTLGHLHPPTSTPGRAARPPVPAARACGVQARHQQHAARRLRQRLLAVLPPVGQRHALQRGGKGAGEQDRGGAHILGRYRPHHQESQRRVALGHILRHHCRCCRLQQRRNMQGGQRAAAAAGGSSGGGLEGSLRGSQ